MLGFNTKSGRIKGEAGSASNTPEPLTKFNTGGIEMAKTSLPKTRLTRQERGCSVDGCPRPHNARGMCVTHYTRWQRNGDPGDAALRVVQISNENFWNFVDKNGPIHPLLQTRCWLWQGSRYTKDDQSYGRLHVNGKTVRAHRYSFFLTNGYWPKNYACHKCDNPPCVRPDHLFDGTSQENQLDSVAKGRNKLPPPRPPRTHCEKGHELTPANTNNAHRCRTCRNAYQRTYMPVWKAKKRRDSLTATD